MRSLLTRLLDLPDIKVESFHELVDQLMLEVEAIKEYATVAQCSQESHNLHQNYRNLVRDGSISNLQLVWLF